MIVVSSQDEHLGMVSAKRFGHVCRYPLNIWVLSDSFLSLLSVNMVKDVQMRLHQSCLSADLHVSMNHGRG